MPFIRSALGTLVLFMLGAPSTLAHHPPRLSNVQLPGQFSAGKTLGAPLQLGINAELHHFEYRVRNQKQSGQRELNVFRLIPSAKVVFKSGTDLQLEMPAGHIFEAGLTGLADPSIAVGQWLSFAKLKLYGNVALSVPLGKSEKKTLFSASDLTHSGRSLEVVTYNIQAALSAQTPMLSALLEARHPLPFSDRIALGARVEAATPLRETHQGLTFGEDLSATLFSQVQLRKFSLGVGFFGEYHFADHSTDTLDAFGERSALGLLASTSVALSKGFSCRAQVQSPLWQRASGAQMLRTLTLTGACITAFDS